MNTLLYIKTINEKCAFLVKEGYTFTQIENNIYYTKETDSEGFRIRFSWLEYGDKFITQGLTAEKRFNIVEQEIQKVLGGKLDNYYTIYKEPSIEYIPERLEYKKNGNNIRFTLTTIKDIELFSELVKSFYKNDVLTFFEDHKIFIETAKFYEKLDREKISSLIINNGTDIFYRELVIKNKSKAIDESNFFEMVVTELESLKTNSTFKTILENFKYLHSNLQTNI